MTEVSRSPRSLFEANHSQLTLVSRAGPNSKISLHNSPRKVVDRSAPPRKRACSSNATTPSRRATPRRTTAS